QRRIEDRRGWQAHAVEQRRAGDGTAFFGWRHAGSHGVVPLIVGGVPVLPRAERRAMAAVQTLFKGSRQAGSPPAAIEAGAIPLQADPASVISDNDVIKVQHFPYGRPDV